MAVKEKTVREVKDRQFRRLKPRPVPRAIKEIKAQRVKVKAITARPLRELKVIRTRTMPGFIGASTVGKSGGPTRR